MKFASYSVREILICIGFFCALLPLSLFFYLNYIEKIRHVDMTEWEKPIPFPTPRPKKEIPTITVSKPGEVAQVTDVIAESQEIDLSPDFIAYNKFSNMVALIKSADPELPR